MTIKSIIEQAHTTAVEKGFWRHQILGTIPAKHYHVPSADPADGPRDVVNISIDYEKIALMHTELAEATEALRDGNLDGDHGVVEELADVVIRIGDYCGARNLDLDAAIKAKLKKNQGRPFMHGRGA